MADELNNSYDVVVVGGGAAGLNGALMLARARRSVVVIDAGRPRNAPAEGVHGLLAREGMPPGELLEHGRAEVRGYGGQVVSGEVTGAVREDDGFTLELADGRTVRSRRLLVTTGLADEIPDIAGLRERWGHDVVHCPYCHGWEVRDQPIGVIANGPMAVHGALLFRQWSADVTLFLHTMDAPSADDAEKLAARGIPVVTGAVDALEITADRISGVRMADGTVLPRTVIAVGPQMVANSDLLGKLGVQTAEHPSGAGHYVPTDAMGRTEAPGVWAAGNVTDLSAQVGAAAAAGAFAAAQINADLVEEETRDAVEKYRRGFGSAEEAAVSERVLGDRRHGL